MKPGDEDRYTAFSMWRPGAASGAADDRHLVRYCNVIDEQLVGMVHHADVSPTSLATFQAIFRDPELISVRQAHRGNFHALAALERLMLLEMYGSREAFEELDDDSIFGKAKLSNGYETV